MTSRALCVVVVAASICVASVAAAQNPLAGITNRQACRAADIDTVGDYEMFSLPIPRRQVVEGQLERTTFSPTQGIGTLPPLLFEASIASHFIARETPDDWRYVPPLLFTASMHSVVRMSMDDSKPVRTPTYSPRLTVYYGRQRTKGCDMWFTTFAHYSNGQEGPSHINGAPNLINGNFSTNYFEIGHIWAAPGADNHSYLRVGSEFHLKPTMDDSSRLHYGWIRPHGQLLLFYRKGNDEVPDYKPGDALDYNRLLMDPAASNGRTSRGFLMLADVAMLPLSKRYGVLEEISGSLLVMYQPKHLEDFGYFASYAFGRDLYNIWYDADYLSVFRFGIMGNSRPLSFGRYVAKRALASLRPG